MRPEFTATNFLPCIAACREQYARCQHLKNHGYIALCNMSVFTPSLRVVLSYDQRSLFAGGEWWQVYV